MNGANTTMVTDLADAQVFCQETLDNHIHQLITLAPAFASVYKVTGTPALRVRENSFAELYKTIVSQQLSVAAAASIWNKLTEANLITPKTIAQASDEQLRACGLSMQKIGYVRSLVAHDIAFDQLPHLPDEAVIDSLTAVKGIGRWTAEIYLLFSLRRQDIMPANDLALKEATRAMLSLDVRPSEMSLRAIATDWQPYRSAAAYLLWAYYAMLKKAT